MDDIERAYFNKMVELGTSLHNGEMNHNEYLQAVDDAWSDFSSRYPDHCFSLYWMSHPYDPRSVEMVIDSSA